MGFAACSIRGGADACGGGGGSEPTESKGGTTSTPYPTLSPADKAVALAANATARAENAVALATAEARVEAAQAESTAVYKELAEVDDWLRNNPDWIVMCYDVGFYDDNDLLPLYLPTEADKLGCIDESLRGIADLEYDPPTP